MTLTCNCNGREFAKHREAFGTLSEFSQYVSSVENIQRLEMEKIQMMAADEVLRQNALANSTKTACEQRLSQLQSQFEDVSKAERITSIRQTFRPDLREFGHRKKDVAFSISRYKHQEQFKEQSLTVRNVFSFEQFQCNLLETDKQLLETFLSLPL